MADESLVELEEAFAAWRRRKRHVREAVPEALIAPDRRQTIGIVVVDTVEMGFVDQI